MNGHLLQITLGPVQGFIASARRSRDLWFGSYILSEISKAVALELHKAGAELIFPAPASALDDLAPWSRYLVANIVTARATATELEAARTLLTAGEDAARARWANLCEEARAEIASVTGDGAATTLAAAVSFVDESIWRAQLGDVVEVFSAAVPLTQDYARANRTLRDLMAGRKNTRDFKPYADTAQRPKSSLDGAQSTVITESAPPRLRRRLGIEAAEQLDTAGMVKRVVGRQRAFVPVARVAAAPWIAKAQADPAGFERLTQAVAELRQDDLVTRLDQRYEEYGWIAPFPFDSELLYAQRIEAAQAARQHEADREGRRLDEEAEAGLERRLAALRRALAPIKGRLGEPPAYYGLLLADGDRMGGLIDKAAQRPEGAQAHRDVSAALSAFAQEVPRLMKDHYGACIYSGGDDVLGLVVLSHAVQCARALADAFRIALEPVARRFELPRSEWPTLSVGVAVAHHLQPLGDVRKWAGDAERMAKGSTLTPSQVQRNALAVLVQPRSGSALSFRVRWDDAVKLDLLERWIEAFESGRFPRGLPHDLQREWTTAEAAYPEMKGKPPAAAVPPDADLSAFWRGQVRRLLSRKRGSGGDAELPAAVKAQLEAEICHAPGEEPGDALAVRRWLRERLDLMQTALWMSGQAEMARW